MGLLTAAAAVVGTVAAGAMSSNAQKKAAKRSADAIEKSSDQATALEREIYYDQRDLLEPSIAAGSQAQARRMLMAGYAPEEVKAYLRQTDSALNGEATPNANGLTNMAAPTTDAYDWVDNWNWEATSPSYDWRVDEGQRALERSAAASGGLFSGDTGMALTEYGQNMGAQEYEADWRRLGELAGDGEEATGTTVNVAGDFGQSAAANTREAGRARATSYQQQGAADANFWGNVVPGAIGTGYGIGRQSGWFGK
jgi:hypothetical protein